MSDLLGGSYELVAFLLGSGINGNNHNRVTQRPRTNLSQVAFLLGSGINGNAARALQCGGRRADQVAFLLGSGINGNESTQAMADDLFAVVAFLLGSGINGNLSHLHRAAQKREESLSY